MKPTMPNRLALASNLKPQFETQIENLAGDTVSLADPMASRALIALMDSYATLGGAACHWGGPAAFAEMISAIHGVLFSKEDWFQYFNFLNDAGHAENGIYAIRANYGFDNQTLDSLMGFRSFTSKLTGHGEAHLNPEGVLLSNGPLGSSLAQAQGLAMADKLSGNSRATIMVVSDGAAMEGEAREAFASIPGIANTGKLNPFVMLVSDNNTKLSGRIDEDAFSMEPTFASLEAQGWNVIAVPNGNNLQEMYKSFEKGLAEATSNPNKPVCLWVKTTKGIGIETTVSSASGGHGFPGGLCGSLSKTLQEIYGNQEVPKVLLEMAEAVEAKANAPKSASSASIPKEKVQAGFARGAIAAAQDGLPVVSLSADLAGSTGMAPFQKSFPSQSFDFGVAESNAFGASVGFARQGYLPITDTFAQFGITKGNLPLLMANLSQSPIVAVLTHAGFQDAADGASHQATHYYAAVSSIPQTLVLSPSCSSEAEFLMKSSLENISSSIQKGNSTDSVVLFAGRENFPVEFSTEPYEWGKARVLREGKDVVLVGFGYMVGQLLEAAELLSNEGIEATVISSAFINKPDTKTISSLLSKANNKLVTLEDHQVIGGAGSILLQALVEENVFVKHKALGVHGEFGQSSYKASELYAKHKMDSAAVVEAVKNL